MILTLICKDSFLQIRSPSQGLNLGIWTYILGATVQLSLQCYTLKWREGIKDLGLGTLPSDVCFSNFVPNTVLKRIRPMCVSTLERQKSRRGGDGSLCNPSWWRLGPTETEYSGSDHLGGK